MLVKQLPRLLLKKAISPGRVLAIISLRYTNRKCRKNNINGTRPSPLKVTAYKDVQTIAQRTTETPSKKSYQPTKEQPKQNIWQSPNKQLQSQQSGNPNKKVEGTKQQQQINPTKKEEGVKQPQQTNPSKKENGVRQPQNTNENTLINCFVLNSTNSYSKLKNSILNFRSVFKIF